MNIEDIENKIGHDQLVKEGWNQTGVQMGIFQRHGATKETPVLIYKKRKIIHLNGMRLHDGVMVRYYNEFGFICTEVNK